MVKIRPWAAILAILEGTVAVNVTITLPNSQPTANLVYSNFLGISFELSVINTYIGETVTSIPRPFVNYLSNVRSRARRPLRLRVGGNSMDSSVYESSQPNMITFTGFNATEHDEPTTFGPILFDVLKHVADLIGGAQYISGLSMRNGSTPNIPLLAAATVKGLGGTLDAFLLGNEPDLYTSHGNRPQLDNYTTQIYFSEFGTITSALRNSSDGDLIAKAPLGGPNTCCRWDLDTIIQEGYITNFSHSLKYIALQHYPTNNCFGGNGINTSYYLQHKNVVYLAAWQKPGIDAARGAGKDVIMGEFNSASCGGLPGVSDTFAATLWTIDYALQMAITGYSGVYLHTRERGVTYNIFDTPENGTDWTTLPSYYALSPVAEALDTRSAASVYDLNLNNSTTADSTVSGYAIYDNTTQRTERLVLFNYAESGSGSATFLVPPSTSNTGNIFVRYLTAHSTTEKTQISWGGQTFAGVVDGISVASKAAPDQQLSCPQGCAVDVPAPGLALVWLDATDKSIAEPDPNSKSSGTSPSFVRTSAWLNVLLVVVNAYCIL